MALKQTPYLSWGGLFLVNDLDRVMSHGTCYQVPNVFFSLDPTADRIYTDDGFEVIETIEQEFMFFDFKDICITEERC